MPATLDFLEARRIETFQQYSAQVSPDCCGSFDLRVAFLETALDEMYRYAVSASKGDLSVREIHELWAKMVQICDFFIDHVRVLAASSRCPVSYDKLLDRRLACDAKAEFHRCC